MDELNTLAELLIKNKLIITTAESCTGGLIAARLTDYPGISSVFHEGYVTYSEAAKENLLGVDPYLIEKYGVVSKEVALAMAEKAAKKAGADIALSSTGIAGPGGFDETHPVGLVFIGCYYEGRSVARGYNFSGDRSEVRTQAVDNAIKLGLDMMSDKFLQF